MLLNIPGRLRHGLGELGAAAASLLARNRDIDRVLERADAALAGGRSDEALAILDRQIAVERKHMAKAKNRQRRVARLLLHRAEVERVRCNCAASRRNLQEALELDPDDLSCWIVLGDSWVAADNLDEAHQVFGQALVAARRLGQQPYQSLALERVGDVLVALGNLPEALNRFRDSCAIRERLAEADPANAGRQLDFAMSYDRIGDVLAAQGKLLEALNSFRDSLAVRERLAEASPDNTAGQRDLSVSCEKIGDVFAAQGEFPAALNSFRSGLAIRERLAQADPGDVAGQGDLAVTYQKIGDVLVAQGKLADALNSFRDSHGIRERLAKADPGNTAWKRELMVARDRIEDVLVAQTTRSEH